jgi:predicted nucleotidyltransferase
MLRVLDRETIDEAVRRLLAAAPAGSRVILFGSYARGEADPESDLDFLVVEPEVEDRRAEMVRLRQALRPMDIFADVLVVSEGVFQDSRDAPSNLIHDAVREGRVYESAP